MVYRATVIALLGSLLVLHIGGEVRSAHHSALTASLTATLVKQPSAAPVVVVQGDTRPVRLPTDTMVVDLRASELARLVAETKSGDHHDQSHSAPARLVPLVRSGTQIGYKIYAIADGGLMATLGFENGDTLLAVNNHPATDFESTSSLLSIIDSRSFSDFSIRRDGRLGRIVVLAHN